MSLDLWVQGWRALSLEEQLRVCELHRDEYGTELPWHNREEEQAREVVRRLHSDWYGPAPAVSSAEEAAHALRASYPEGEEE